MKKFIKYLEWIPFAICLGSILIYIIYTIRVKINPAIIVTDQLVSTLKTYLIISLISLFIGLLIILIKKIHKLTKPTVKSYVRHTIKEEKIIEEPKVIVEETKIIEEPKVTIEEPIKEEKIEVKKEYVYKLEGVVCPECGLSISPNAAICPHCGILFDEEIIKVIKKYEKSKNKEVRKNSLMVTIANILLIILFIFLIYLMWNPIKERINNYRNSYSIIQKN